MTNEEMANRITRLETCLDATQSLLTCFLTAIDPTRRPLIETAFREWCCRQEAQLFQDDGPAAMTDWHLAELSTMHSKLIGSMQQIAAHEKTSS